ELPRDAGGRRSSGCGGCVARPAFGADGCVVERGWGWGWGCACGAVRTARGGLTACDDPAGDDAVAGGSWGAGGSAESARPDSNASIRLLFCSIARSASQFEKATTSRLRRGASIGPLSVTTTSGRVLPSSFAGPDKASLVSIALSVSMTLPPN